MFFPFCVLFKCFCVSMGDILSAWCDIKMYRTPIQTMSYDTGKYCMPLGEILRNTGKVSHVS